VISPDTEIMALQSMLRGLEHIKKKNLTEDHLAIVIAVQFCIKAFKINPTAAQIANAAGLIHGPALDAAILELVRLRYLYECEPKVFSGNPVPTYRLGTTGGAAVRKWAAPAKAKVEPIV
jgi:hypothetical protein